MLVGVFGDEAVSSGLLEVSITMCICTYWMGRGLRLGESLFRSVRFREILFAVSSSILITMAISRIQEESMERETKKQTISQYLCV